jgi:hypothetical protein
MIATAIPTDPNQMTHGGYSDDTGPIESAVPEGPQCQDGTISWSSFLFCLHILCSNFQHESPGVFLHMWDALSSKFKGHIVIKLRYESVQLPRYCTTNYISTPKQRIYLLAKVSHPNSILKSRNFSESVSEENCILITKIVEMIQELLCFDSI